MLAPLDDQRHPNELDILKSGAYNLGFIALANQPVTHQFLHWRFTCKIRLVRNDSWPLGLQLLGPRMDALPGGGNRDVRSLRQQPPGDSEANTSRAPRARHNGASSVELECHLKSVCVNEATVSAELRTHPRALVARHG